MGNPNHDELGRFADGDGGGTGDKTTDHAISGKVDPHVHAGRLKAALGKDDEFKATLKEVGTGSREHAVTVANEFHGPLAAGTSKTKALDRIYARHKKLMDFKDLGR